MQLVRPSNRDKKNRASVILIIKLVPGSWTNAPSKMKHHKMDPAVAMIIWLEVAGPGPKVTLPPTLVFPNNGAQVMNT